MSQYHLPKARLLPLLLGCYTSFRSTEGTEPVRAALWFPDAPLETGVVPHAGVLVLANSPLGCEPEALADDPKTDVDEAAASYAYWEGEVAAAFTREDALVVVLGLYTRSPAWGGTYTLLRTAWEDPAEAIATHERTGFGAWLRIEEAEVDELDGLFYVYEPRRYSYNYAVEAPAEANVEVDGSTVRGDFRFDIDHLSGDFEAEECENTSLYAQIWSVAEQLGVDADDLADEL